MVRCCTELGRLTQAVVLMQFTQDPNYAQVMMIVIDLRIVIIMIIDLLWSGTGG